MNDRDELFKRLHNAIEHCDMGAYEARLSNRHDLADSFESALEILYKAEDKFYL